MLYNEERDEENAKLMASVSPSEPSNVLQKKRTIKWISDMQHTRPKPPSGQDSYIANREKIFASEHAHHGGMEPSGTALKPCGGEEEEETAKQYTDAYLSLMADFTSVRS